MFNNVLSELCHSRNAFTEAVAANLRAPVSFWQEITCREIMWQSKKWYKIYYFEFIFIIIRWTTNVCTFLTSKRFFPDLSPDTPLWTSSSISIAAAIVILLFTFKTRCPVLNIRNPFRPIPERSPESACAMRYTYSHFTAIFSKLRS